MPAPYRPAGSTATAAAAAAAAERACVAQSGDGLRTLLRGSLATTAGNRNAAANADGHGTSSSSSAGAGAGAGAGADAAARYLARCAQPRSLMDDRSPDSTDARSPFHSRRSSLQQSVSMLLLRVLRVRCEQSRVLPGTASPRVESRR